MRKRDWFFAGLFALGVIGYLVWALTTQLRWARSNQPIQVLRPEEPKERPVGRASGTEVVGPINDDTRAALEKNLKARNRGK